MFPTLILPRILGMELSDIIWQPSSDGAWLVGTSFWMLMRLSPRRLLDVRRLLGCSGSGPTIDIDIDNILVVMMRRLDVKGAVRKHRMVRLHFGYQQGVSLSLAIGLGGTHSTT